MTTTDSAEPGATPAPLPDRVRNLTLCATILGSSIGFLDATVLSVALPTIADDLGFGLTGQQLVNVSYTLSLTALFLLAGAIGDRLGQRRVFIAGTIAFALASALAGMAWSTTVLIMARVAQGAAGAFLATTSLALLRITWGRDAARAIGLWTAGTSIATVAGPFAGGAITQYYDWRWIFLLNIPLAVVAVACAAFGRPLPAQDPARPHPVHGLHGLDLAGAALGALSITSLTYFLVQGQEDGFAHMWSAAVIATASAVGFAARELSAQSPLVRPSLFRDRNFTAANLATFLIYAALGGSLFYLGLYLQSHAIGFSALQAGLWMMPVSIAMILLAARFGNMADARGPRRLLIGGPLLMAAGMVSFLLIDDRSPFGGLAEGMVLYGVGLAMLVAPITATALQAAPEEHSGIAAAINTALARLGGVIAVALMGVVISAVFANQVGDSARSVNDPFSRKPQPGVAAHDVFDAYRTGMLISIAFVLAGALVAAVGIDDAAARRAGGHADLSATC